LWEHIYLGDLPVAVIGSAGGVFPVLSDHLGTPRQVINASKQLRWKWDNTEPFGANVANQNPANLGVFAYNLRFPGQFYDAETGLHYNYFRDYDPKNGRYVESDPIGLDGGLNTYGYVGGNPLSFIDPEGLVTCSTIFKIPFFDIQMCKKDAQEIVDELNKREDGKVTIPWPPKEPGKTVCVCRAQDLKRLEGCKPKFGYGFGIANDARTARNIAEDMAQSFAGGSDQHHTQCKCVGPKGDKL
jgi:RHS repeat-associated protein